MFHEGNGKVCTRVGQGLGTAQVVQEGLGKMAENRMAQGMSLSARTLAAILSWGKGVRDLLSGDRAEFGFPLAPAGGCAVFFQ